jgi:hypothetical protein
VSFGALGVQNIEPNDIKMMNFMTILGGKEYSVVYAALS